MQIRRFLFLAAVLLFLTCRAADAQDAGKVGVTMGYPASIGILWHVSDKVAIRPELSIAGGSSEGSGGSFSAESDNFTFGTGVSVNFYLHTYDKLKTYFSPRFTYSRSTTENSSSGVTTSSFETTSTNTGGSGSFGAQYELSDKFSLYGELGVVFAYTKATNSNGPSKTTGNAWSTRSGAGVVFYF